MTRYCGKNPRAAGQIGAVEDSTVFMLLVAFAAIAIAVPLAIAIGW